MSSSHLKLELIKKATLLSNPFFLEQLSSHGLGLKGLLVVMMDWCLLDRWLIKYFQKSWQSSSHMELEEGNTVVNHFFPWTAVLTRTRFKGTVGRDDGWMLAWPLTDKEFSTLIAEQFTYGIITDKEVNTVVNPFFPWTAVLTPTLFKGTVGRDDGLMLSWPLTDIVFSTLIAEQFPYGIITDKKATLLSSLFFLEQLSSHGLCLKGLLVEMLDWCLLDRWQIK